MTAAVVMAVMLMPASLDSIEWLACSWRGTGVDMDVEMTLVPPSAGSIMGVFKSSRDGQVIFYEFIVIGEFDGMTAVRLKHFRPDMTGWEAADRWMEFRLLEAVPGRLARFEGLSFRMDGDGHMIASVMTRQRDGTEVPLEFVYRRVDPC